METPFLFHLTAGKNEDPPLGVRSVGSSAPSPIDQSCFISPCSQSRTGDAGSTVLMLRHPWFLYSNIRHFITSFSILLYILVCLTFCRCLTICYSLAVHLKVVRDCITREQQEVNIQVDQTHNHFYFRQYRSSFAGTEAFSPLSF
eukprot:gene1558-942_t